MEDDGLVVPEGTGMVRVTAVTHDGGYRASVIVNVISTKALGADVYAVGADGTEYAAEESSAEDADYELTLPLGSYVFETYAQPASVTVDAGYSASPYGEYGTEGGFTVHAVSGRAEAKLSGRYMLTVNMSPAADGCGTVRVLVTVTGDGFTAEGSADEEVAVRLAAGTDRAVIYAESGSAVDISAPLPDGIESASADVLSEERGQYAVSVVFSEDVTAAGGSTALTLSSGGEIRRVTFVFAEEHAEIYGRFEDGDADVFVQKTESLLTYAAVSGLYGGDVGYRFELEGGAAEIASQDADNGTCTLRGLAPGEAVLSLFVTYGGREELADVRTVLVVEGYTHFVFTENASTWGIGGVYAVGGVGYADGAFTACATALGFGRAYGTDIIRSVSDDIVFTVSDPSLAEVAAEDGGVYFTAKGTGRVTVTAEWKYTELFPRRDLRFAHAGRGCRRRERVRLRGTCRGDGRWQTRGAASRRHAGREHARRGRHPEAGGGSVAVRQTDRNHCRLDLLRQPRRGASHRELRHRVQERRLRQRHGDRRGLHHSGHAGGEFVGGGIRQ